MSPTIHPLGQVTLVGAGPGDPDLLTLQAVKALQAATVVFVDDLVNPAITAMAAAAARIIHVGKRGGCTSTPQSFIEKLMIAAAAEGENVVRLKGGDPLMFGRGGEEVAHLQAAGVRVSVVNGITAGLAAATSLKVSLTHREHAQGVMFVTGHASPGQPAQDWAQLGRTATQARMTLVIYMGVAACASIQKGLLQTMLADTPVAVIENASLPQQRQLLCKLANVHQRLIEQGLGSPAVLIVGAVLNPLALLADGGWPRSQAA